MYGYLGASVLVLNSSCLAVKVVISMSAVIIIFSVRDLRYLCSSVFVVSYRVAKALMSWFSVTTASS